MVTLPSLPTSRPLPKSGPFPPPALLGFNGTTSLSATPHGPDLALAGVRLVLANHRWGLPCCVGFRLWRAVALTPAGPPSGIMDHSPGLRRHWPSPLGTEGRLLQSPFSGPARRSRKLRPAHSLSRLTTLCHSRLRPACYLPSRLNCYRLE